MTTRERFRALMNFQPFDRLPVIEWAAWWNKTVDRWKSEGLEIRPEAEPPFVNERYQLCRQFGMDIYFQGWLGPSRQHLPQPAEHGAPVLTTPAEYEAGRELMYRHPPYSINPQIWESWARLQQSGEAVIWFSMPGFFWHPRTLLGIEPHLYAFYDEPEWMHRINADLAEWQIQHIDAVCEICTPDFMTFAEDMSYNHGPMLSEELFDEFLLPYYQQVVPHLKKKGILTIIDSDGDVTVPLRWFERAGLEGILPLERQAGVDIATLRAAHPNLRFIGHFDKMTMNKGEAAMRAEFERILPTAAKGGFIPGVDHQTPPGVSLKDYELFLALFREYAAECGRMSRSGT